jgi:hypothetical protein
MIDQETRRWGWLAIALGAGALLTALACALAGVWIAGALFAIVGLGLLDIGWLRLRGRMR